MSIVWQLLDSSSIGGIEKHVAVITESLRNRGVDARIILYENHGDSPWLDQLTAADLSARCLDGTCIGLYQAMKSDRPVLVHTHGYKGGILGRLTARLLGIPSVTTFHMGETPKWPVNAYTMIDNLTSLLSTRIAVSEDIKAKLTFSSTIISNYIQVPRELPAFDPAPPQIGFVGRLSHEKAPDYFCELARRKGPSEYSWHMYGDGPMRAELQATYGDHVTFHGMVTDMTSVWSNLGLCIMPSRAEGLPLASIEALSAGVPVVASNVGDLSKVVIHKNSGWLAPAGDLDAFEAAISQWMALSPNEKTELRKTSWAHARAHFSEETSLPALLEIYSKLGVRPPKDV